MRDNTTREEEEEEDVSEDVLETLKKSAPLNTIGSQARSNSAPDDPPISSLQNRKRADTVSSTRPSEDEAAVNFKLLNCEDDFAVEPQVLDETPLFLPSSTFENSQEHSDDPLEHAQMQPTVREPSDTSTGRIIVPASLSQSQSQPQSQSQVQSSNDKVSHGDSAVAQYGSSAPRVETNDSPTAALHDDANAAQASVEIIPEASGGTFSSASDFIEQASKPNGSQKERELKKIPQISPSKFKPYLPAPQKPLSAFPPPVIARAVNGATHESTSSIEMTQESSMDPKGSPRRGRRSRSKDRSAHETENEDSEIDTSMSRSLELKQRGLELAEAHRLQGLASRERECETPSVQLQVILKGLNGQAPEGRPVEREAAPQGSKQLAEDTKDVKHATGTATDANGLLDSPLPSSLPLALEVQGLARASTSPEDEDTRVQQFEEAYLNLDADFLGVVEETYNTDGWPAADDMNEPIVTKEPSADEGTAEKLTSGGGDEDDEIEEEDVVAATASDGGRRSTPTTATTSQQVYHFHF